MAPRPALSNDPETRTDSPAPPRGAPGAPAPAIATPEARVVREEPGQGYVTLRRMRRLGRYNAWIVERIRGALGRRVLEVGSGIGTMSRLLPDSDLLVLTDIDEEYLARLRGEFGRLGHVRVRRLDLNAFDPEDFRSPAPDTVICLNVLEHVERDEAALRNLRAVLAPGGRLALLVPALPSLYGRIDASIGHHRRYARAGLAALLRRTGFAIESLRYFNILGVPGWFLNARVLRRRAVPPLQSALYDHVVPLARLEDRFELPFGLSLIAIARKAG